ncbi:MAG: ribosome assembly cofactor RimP [Sphingobacterium sp.]|uniref:ribosome assembly cofactor RimP n=1 Tax=Sphingobacterium sp. JB170 TaxID=1434842 RepID=UPI00097EC9F9|nr:ribosome assembly cofactor RimP [Sphingobacterium sp. JB170]SJN15637.1 clustered with transcription termination protein NusA [Sphingobacterium sp. JB170]
MQIEERVRALVEEKIADREDLFIVSIKMQRNGLLEISIDGDQGVPIEDCAKISRHVGFHLEEENAIEAAYRLEVSSPGVDTPLLLHRQYVKNIGRLIRITGVDGQKIEGELTQVNDTSITINQKIKEKGKKATTQDREIPFTDITETKVLISFK